MNNVALPWCNETKRCRRNGKRRRPWSDCSSGVVWSGSTLFAQTYLFENLWSLRQFHHVENGYLRFEEIRFTSDLATHVLNKKYLTLVYRKFPKYSDTQNICCNHSKIWTMWLYHRVMSQNDADGMANSVDPEQSDLGLHCLPRHICPKT